MDKIEDFQKIDSVKNSAINSSVNEGEKIVILEVDSKKKLREFIHLPAAIHKDHHNWVPPIYMDDWEFFNPKVNKSFQSCETIMLLAYHKNKIVGRIMGIIHLKYNALHHEKNARFAFFETWNDDEIARCLIHAIENWSREKGMGKIDWSPGLLR